MKKIFTTLFLLVISSCVSEWLFSAEKPVALFLLNADPGVCMQSMGGVFSTLSAEDAFYNPWALGLSVNSGVGFSHWPGNIEGANFNFAGGVIQNGNNGAFSVNYIGYSAGEDAIEELDGSVRNVRFEENQLISFGYGKALSENISVGFGAKYLRSTLFNDYTASAMFFDAGMLYTSLNNRHAFGFSLRNLGNSIKYFQTNEPLPREFDAGYSIKLSPAKLHELVLGASLAKVINDNNQNIVFGLEYFPPLPYISFRTGLNASNTETQFSAGIGLKYQAMDFGFGCKLTPSAANDATSLSFGANWLFGPQNSYDVAEKYFDRGSIKKAVALWKEITPDMPHYKDAKSKIDICLNPPVFVVSGCLCGGNKNGKIQSGETAIIELSVYNKGKNRAVNIVKELKEFSNRQVSGNLIIDTATLNVMIDYISSGDTAVIRIPVIAVKTDNDIRANYIFNVHDSMGFNAEPFVFAIGIQKESAPSLVLAKYIYIESDVDKANGILEKGKKITISGYVVNSGDRIADDAVMQIASNVDGISVSTQSVDVGHLGVGEHKKIVFNVYVSNSYLGSNEILLKIKFYNKSCNYSAEQIVKFKLNKFYNTAIMPLFVDAKLYELQNNLPEIIGSSSKFNEEDLTSKIGYLPDLETEAVLIDGDNKNGIYESGEHLCVVVCVSNRGGGAAKNIKIDLRGDELLRGLFGETAVFNLNPGESKRIELSATVPENVVPKDSEFSIKVSEGRGFSSLDEKKFTVKLQQKVHKAISELPSLK